MARGVRGKRTKSTPKKGGEITYGIPFDYGQTPFIQYDNNLIQSQLGLPGIKFTTKNLPITISGQKGFYPGSETQDAFNLNLYGGIGSLPSGQPINLGMNVDLLEGAGNLFANTQLPGIAGLSFSSPMNEASPNVTATLSRDENFDIPGVGQMMNQITFGDGAPTLDTSVNIRPIEGLLSLFTDYDPKTPGSKLGFEMPMQLGAKMQDINNPQFYFGFNSPF